LHRELQTLGFVGGYLQAPRIGSKRSTTGGAGTRPSTG
jgi:hypothetical protein